MELENNREAAAASRVMFELNQLQVRQSDGIVRKGDGTVVGREKWLVNVDYSLDTKESEDFIVNAASEEEAESKVLELLEGVAKRKGMQVGSVFMNHSSPKAVVDGK